MVDNIFDEIRVCSKCGTKTFCDYCPKCGSKMPPSRSMHKSVFKRDDFDKFQKGQARSHSGDKQNVKRQIPYKPADKQTKITPQKSSFNGLKIIAYVIVIIIILFLLFHSGFSIEQIFK